MADFPEAQKPKRREAQALYEPWMDRRLSLAKEDYLDSPSIFLQTVPKSKFRFDAAYTSRPSPSVSSPSLAEEASIPLPRTPTPVRPLAAVLPTRDEPAPQRLPPRLHISDALPMKESSSRDASKGKIRDDGEESREKTRRDMFRRRSKERFTVEFRWKTWKT